MTSCTPCEEHARFIRRANLTASGPLSSRCVFSSLADGGQHPVDQWICGTSTPIRSPQIVVTDDTMLIIPFNVKLRY